MRSAAIALALSALVGCSNEASVRLPTVPGGGPFSPVTPTSATLWVMVFEEHGPGICLPGATIQVVSETGDVGEPITQQPCGYWDYGGGVELKGLTPGVPVKLRASASGFISLEKTFMPCTSGCRAQSLELTPKRTE
jgi:hypothetical protein